MVSIVASHAGDGVGDAATGVTVRIAVGDARVLVGVGDVRAGVRVDVGCCTTMVGDGTSVPLIAVSFEK